MLVFSIFTDTSSSHHHQLQNTGIAPLPQLWKAPPAVVTLHIPQGRGHTTCGLLGLLPVSQINVCEVPHAPARVSIPFHCSVTSPCVQMSHWIHPVVSSWTPGQLTPFGVHEHSHTSFCLDVCFPFCWVYTRDWNCVFMW